ncbi:MAG: hypothetical protein U0667_15370 [Chloroflexota bacterium]
MDAPRAAGARLTPEQVVEALASDGTRIRLDYDRQLEAGTRGQVPGLELLRRPRAPVRVEPQPLPEPEPEEPELSPDTLAIVAAIYLSDGRPGSRRSDELAAVVSQAVLATLRSIWSARSTLSAMRVRRSSSGSLS